MRNVLNRERMTALNVPNSTPNLLRDKKKVAPGQKHRNTLLVTPGGETNLGGNSSLLNNDKRHTHQSKKHSLSLLTPGEGVSPMEIESER